MMDISDFGLILSRFNTLSVLVNSTNQIYDVNNDGVIDILDIGIVLSNYTALSVHGN